MTNNEVSGRCQIYVACLAAYNNGILHGRWIDANQDADRIYAEIASVLNMSPESGAEEWAVHDYEGFGDIHLTEWPDIKRVATLARLIADHGDAFTVWYQVQDGDGFDVNDLEEKFLEQSQGPHDSDVEFVESLLESTGQLSELPAWAQSYFDFGSYARVLRLSGDYSFIPHNGQVYVFSNY